MRVRLIAVAVGPNFCLRNDGHVWWKESLRAQAGNQRRQEEKEFEKPFFS